MKKIINLMIVLAGILLISSCSDETFKYDGAAQVAFANITYSGKVGTEISIPIQLIAGSSISDLSVGVSIVSEGTTVTGVTIPATVNIPAGKYSAMLTFNTGSNTGTLILQLSSSTVKVSETLGSARITIVP
jgi:hypothetical protein